MHACGGQVIHPHRVLIERRFEGSPPGVLTQASQHDFETVVGAIDALDRLPGRDPKGPKPLGYPGFNMHHAVVTPGQHGAKPDGTHPAQAEAGPVARGGKMGIAQRRQTHPLHLFDQQRNVVNALCDDVGYCMHAQSLAQSGIYLQIWANREFKFVQEEWQPGHRVVYVRNPDYVPRAEPPSFGAGGKRVYVDRVEWLNIPDAATASAALAAGEVDYWENPPVDFVSQLEKNAHITVRVVDAMGTQGWLRPNHLHPPFSDKRARQALLYSSIRRRT